MEVLNEYHKLSGEKKNFYRHERAVARYKYITWDTTYNLATRGSELLSIYNYMQAAKKQPVWA